MSAVSRGIQFVAQATSGFLRGSALIAEGQAERRAAEETALGLENQARFVNQATEEEVQSFQRQAKQLEGTAVANAAASGFKISGGASDLIASNARTIQRDVDNIRLRGRREAFNLVQEANLLRRRGRLTERSARIAAAAAKFEGFFGGFGTLAGFAAAEGSRSRGVARIPTGGGGSGAPGTPSTSLLF